MRLDSSWPNCKRSAKDRFAEDEQQQEEDAHFHDFPPGSNAASVGCSRIINGAIRRSPVVSPSHHVSQIARKLAESGKSTKCKTGYAKSWTDTVLTTAASATYNTLRTIEDGCAAGEPIHEPGTGHRFERIAARDGERCGTLPQW